VRAEFALDGNLERLARKLGVAHSHADRLLRTA
jgi:hypothetical protein